MHIEQIKQQSTTIRFAYKDEGTEVAHAYLALIHNDLHEEPFGLLEDLHVDPAYRGKGIAKQLMRTVIEAARTAGCYKLIATSRLGGTRDNIHYWYERLGFESYGVEFRMNL